MHQEQLGREILSSDNNNMIGAEKRAYTLPELAAIYPSLNVPKLRLLIKRDHLKARKVARDYFVHVDALDEFFKGETHVSLAQ